MQLNKTTLTRLVSKLGQAIYIGGPLGIIYFWVYIEIDNNNDDDGDHMAAANDNDNNNDNIDNDENNNDNDDNDYNVVDDKRNLMFGILFKNVFF